MHYRNSNNELKTNAGKTSLRQQYLINNQFFYTKQLMIDSPVCFKLCRCIGMHLLYQHLHLLHRHAPALSTLAPAHRLLYKWTVHGKSPSITTDPNTVQN